MATKEYNTIRKIEQSGKVAYELYDRKFSFKSVNGDYAVKVSEKMELYICLNGKQTKTAINELFVGSKSGISYDSDCLRGYSPLQMIDTSNGQIEIGNKKVAISFIDKNSGTEIYISEVKKPFIIWNDEIVSVEKMTEFGDILIGKSVEYIKPIEEIKPAYKETPHGGEEFFQKRQELLAEGYDEFSFGDYRIYCLEEDEENEEVIFIKVNKSDYTDLVDTLELIDENKDEPTDVFCFFENNKKMLLLINREAGKMEVKLMPDGYLESLNQQSSMEESKIIEEATEATEIVAETGTSNTEVSK